MSNSDHSGSPVTGSAREQRALRRSARRNRAMAPTAQELGFTPQALEFVLGLQARVRVAEESAAAASAAAAATGLITPGAEATAEAKRLSSLSTLSHSQNFPTPLTALMPSKLPDDVARLTEGGIPVFQTHELPTILALSEYARKNKNNAESFKYEAQVLGTIIAVLDLARQSLQDYSVLVTRLVGADSSEAPLLTSGLGGLQQAVDYASYAAKGRMSCLEEYAVSGSPGLQNMWGQLFGNAQTHTYPSAAVMKASY